MCFLQMRYTLTLTSPPALLYTVNVNTLVLILNCFLSTENGLA
jgi:hypothetical protein